MDLDSFASMLASQMNRPAVPIRQQVDTLKRLGIRLTPEQEEGFLSQSARYEDPAYAAILTELGAADSDQVYAFDAEVTQRSTMYRDLIGALLRLTGGELDLQDVRESGENADLEGPGGTWRVSFTMNGHPYQYDADFLGDWLDVNVLAFLNSALEKEKIKKRFLTVDDFNIQGVVVFFRTPEWGRFFSAGTQLAVKGC